MITKMVLHLIINGNLDLMKYNIMVIIKNVKKLDFPNKIQRLTDCILNF